MFIARRLSSRRSSRVLAILLAVAMVGPTIAGPGLATAQEVKAGVVTTLQGQAVVARPVIQQPLALKFKDDVFVRDRVETREDSLVRILLGGKALVTVRELSTFTVTEEPGRAVLDLRSGKAAVGVAPSLLRPGESIEVRTPNAVAGIRGSLLVMNVEQVGNDVRTTFQALQVSKPITVSPLGTPGVTIQLNANQSVGVLGVGAQTRVGPVTNMTPAQAQAAARTAEAPRPKEQATSSPMASEIAAASMSEATQLASALQGSPTADPMFQQATIDTALNGGAIGDLPTRVTATSEFDVDTFQANRVAESLAPVAQPIVAQPIVAQPIVEPPIVEPPIVEPPIVEPPIVEPPIVVPPILEPEADVVIRRETRVVESGQSLKMFTGNSSRPASTPIVLIDQSTVTGDSSFIEVAPGSETAIAGPLLKVTNSTLDTGGNLVHVNSGSLGSAPVTPALLSFDPSTVRAGTGVIRLDGDAALTVRGSLLTALGTSFSVGNPTSNTSPFLAIFDGSSLEQSASGGAALLVFDGSSVNSAGSLVNVRRSPSALNRSQLTLDGPLFRAVNRSTFNTTSLGFGATFGTPTACCTAFSVRQGAELTSTTTDALIQLAGGSIFNAGPDAQSGSTFFAVSDTFTAAPAGELVAPSRARLAGPLLRLTEGSSVTALFNLLDITRSTFQSDSPQALIQLAGGSSVGVGGFNPITEAAATARILNLTGAGASLSLTGGGLLSAVDSSITSESTAQLFGIFAGASLTQTDTSAPLFSLTRSTVDSPARGAAFLEVRGATSEGSLPTRVGLSGSLLSADASTIVSGGNLMRISSGGEVTTTLTGVPLIKFTGGSFQGGISGQVTGGSLLRMFSDQDTGDTKLSIGKYFESVGATITSRDGATFSIGDGAVITSVGPGPFARFEGGSVTADGTNGFISIANNTSFTTPGQPATLGNRHAPVVSVAGTMAELTASSPGGVVVDSGGSLMTMTGGGAFPAPVVSIGGSLLAARNATITTGDPLANTNTVLFIADGSTLRTTGSAPLLSFDASNVDSAGNIVTLRRSTSGDVPSTLRLGGPLFVATNGSSFNTTSQGQITPVACCSGFFIGQGAQLFGPSSAAALIQLEDSTFVSRDAQSGGTFFSLSDRDSSRPTEFIGPSLAALDSPLLSARNSSIAALFSLLSVTRSAFVDARVGSPLITLDHVTVNLGGADPFNPATPTVGGLLTVSGSAPGDAPPLFNGLMSLAGPFLKATGSQLTMTGDAINVSNGGAFLGGSVNAVLVELDNSQLTTGPSAFPRGILEVNNVGGENGTTPSTAVLRGTLLNAAGGSTLNLTAGFVEAYNGGQVVVSGPGATNSLVTLQGGSHTLATGAAASPQPGMGMFELFGRSANVVLNGGVVESADQPLLHGGPLLETNGAVIGDSTPSQRFLRLGNAVLDPTLFEASLPLLKATNNSRIRTAMDAIDLSVARLTVAGDLVQLNASQFDVVSGALASVRNQSRLMVGGNLVTLVNGSTLNLLNGPVLNVSGNSRVDIGGALIGFVGAGNTVNISNNLCAAGCATIGGLRVQLNGTPAGNVMINNPVTGAGTINIPANAAHLSVSGAGSRVTIGAH